MYVESGGQDTEFWNGWYGTIIEQASATVGTWEMRFSNDGSAWGAWAAFAPTAPWTLTAGAGEKTVYVQYRYLGILEYGPFTDTITLNSPPP